MIDSDHDLHKNNIRQNMYGFIIDLLIQKAMVRYAPNLVGWVDGGGGGGGGWKW